MNSDLLYSPFAFSATEITFTAVTPKGREVLAQCFGAGAISVKLRKSGAADFINFASRQCVVIDEELANSLK